MHAESRGRGDARGMRSEDDLGCLAGEGLDRTCRSLGVVVAASTLLLAARADAQIYYEPPPESFYADDRVRFTAEGQLGAVLGAVAAVATGASISVGLQTNDIVAIYATHRLVLVHAADDTTFATSFNAAVLEVTVFDHIQLGVGPSLDVGIGGLCAPNALVCEGLSDLRLGLETRLAVVLGHRSPSARSGLSIALTVHPTWVDRNTASTTVALSVGHALY